MWKNNVVSDQEIIFERTIPILRMFDVAKAREFYLDYLGFEVEFEHRFDVEAPHGDGTPGTHVIIRVSGIDALHRELLAKKYRYFNPSIQTQEWGTQEMIVYDPFNNRLVFSERIDSSGAAS
jgi:hypothetical protein